MIVMKVAIQGTSGSFHHLAARRWFDGSPFEILPCENFSEVFSALKNNQADQAIIAIENSLHGSINQVYDLLLKYKFPVVGELPERIHQQLIGFENTELESIRRVYSHPVALTQCAEFLDEFLPQAERIEHSDTASSVALIKQQNNPKHAAIAGKTSAEEYGLEILKANIEDDPSNFTRFLVVNPNAEKITTANKASLALRTNHTPGALYRALGVFENLSINLTKLHSRPIRGQVWQYQFFIDAELNADKLQSVEKQLRAQDCQLTVLGHYRSAKTTDLK